MCKMPMWSYEFCENIGDVIGRRNFVKKNNITTNVLAGRVKANVDVTGPLGDDVFVHLTNSSFVVDEDGNRRGVNAEVVKEIFDPGQLSSASAPYKATSSASKLDRTSKYWLRNHQATIEPQRRKQ